MKYSTVLLACVGLATAVPASVQPSVQPSVRPSVVPSVVPSMASWASWIPPSRTVSASVAPATPSCPGKLPGTVLLPYLTVPVSKKQPTRSFGDSHNKTLFTPNDLGTVINFNIPQAAYNKTCSLYFSFPSKAQSPGERYIYHGLGNFQFKDFLYAPDANVTYNTLPPVFYDLGNIKLKPGNFYHLSSIPCPIGKISGVTFSNDTELRYWQTDKNGRVNGKYAEGCPIGLFTTYQ